MSEQDVDGTSATSERDADAKHSEKKPSEDEPEETTADGENTEAATEDSAEKPEEESEQTPTADETDSGSTESIDEPSSTAEEPADESEDAEEKPTDTEFEEPQASEEGSAKTDTGESLEEIAEKPDAGRAALESLLAEEDTVETIPVGEELLTDDPDDQLVEAVEETPAETLAQIIETVQAQQTQIVEQLSDAREQIDDLESRLARKQADFQNYKQRQKREQKRIKEQATEDFVTRILDVRDNLARALDQDEDVDIRGGVESTLKQFDQQLDRENVTRIEPEEGEDVDPKRHEVLATIASGQPEDTIAAVHRPGYEMGEKVLRPAQVAVSDGSQHEPASDEPAEQE